MSSNKSSSPCKVLPSKEVLPSCDRIISMNNRDLPFDCMQNKHLQMARQSCLLSNSVGHAHPKFSPHTHCSYTTHTRTTPSYLQTDVQLTASSSEVVSSKDTVLQQKKPNNILEQTPASQGSSTLYSMKACPPVTLLEPCPPAKSCHPR